MRKPENRDRTEYLRNDGVSAQNARKYEIG